jgi:hypothetical protein
VVPGACRVPEGWLNGPPVRWRSLIVYCVASYVGLSLTIGNICDLVSAPIEPHLSQIAVMINPAAI